MTAPRVRALQDLAGDIRQKTLFLLDATRPSELTWAPAGTSNHLLWHAGHALWLQDVLCLRLLTGRSELPPGYEALFQMGSRPASQTKPWPRSRELRQHLQAQLLRLREVLDPVTDSDLDGLPRHAHPGDRRTLWQCVSHGLHDEANHQGEMYLLLKMQRLGERGSPGSGE
jgi:hypothetical protein